MKNLDELEKAMREAGSAARSAANEDARSVAEQEMCEVIEENLNKSLQ